MSVVLLIVLFAHCVSSNREAVPDYDCSCCDVSDSFYRYNPSKDYKASEICGAGYHLPRAGSSYDLRISTQCSKYAQKLRVSADGNGKFLLSEGSKEICRHSDYQCKKYVLVCIKDECKKPKWPTPQPTWPTLAPTLPTPEPTWPTMWPTPLPTPCDGYEPWGPWSAWSKCQTLPHYKYGDGGARDDKYSIRTRECVCPGYGGYCDGEDVEVKKCDKECDAEWTEWSDFSQCIVDRYDCTYDGYSSSDCKGFRFRSRKCDKNKCSADCECDKEYDEWQGKAIQTEPCRTKNCFEVECKNKGKMDCTPSWTISYGDYVVFDGDYKGNRCVELDSHKQYKLEVENGCGEIEWKYKGKKIGGYDYDLYDDKDDEEAVPTKKYFDVQCPDY